MSGLHVWFTGRGAGRRAVFPCCVEVSVPLFFPFPIDDDDDDEEDDDDKRRGCGQSQSHQQKFKWLVSILLNLIRDQLGFTKSHKDLKLIDKILSTYQNYKTM